MSASLETELPPFGAEMAVIALGGAIGSCLRFGVSLGMGAAQLHGALAAGCVNLLGSFLLGLLVGHFESGKAHPLLRPFLSVGVFGSFTTFSALALDNRASRSRRAKLWLPPISPHRSCSASPPSCWVSRVRG